MSKSLRSWVDVIPENFEHRLVQTSIPGFACEILYVSGRSLKFTDSLQFARY